MDVANTVVTVVLPTLTAGALGNWFGARQERGKTVRGLQRKAGQRYLATLREIRRLFRVSDHEDQSPEVWVNAFAALSDVHDDYRHRLPDGWSHLRRSLRAAIGTYAGAVSFADMDSHADRYPIAKHDEQWRQYGLEFVEMVIDRLQRWTDEPWNTRRLPQVEDFDGWLASTGRHVPFMGRA